MGWFRSVSVRGNALLVVLFVLSCQEFDGREGNVDDVGLDVGALDAEGLSSRQIDPGNSLFDQSGQAQLRILACMDDGECEDGDSCTLNVCGNGWVDMGMTPGAGSVAYDPVREVVVLVRGFAGIETWEFDGERWERVHVSAEPVRSGPLVYDTWRNETLMFTESGVWSWDGANWIHKSAEPAVTPLDGVIGSWAFDKNRGVSVLYIYRTGVNERIREWDGLAWTTHTTAIESYWGTSMTYDPIGGVVMQVGGSRGYGAGGETNYKFARTWDGTVWTARLAPPHMFSEVTYGALAYHIGLGKVVLYGGTNYDGDMDPRLYGWDGSTWEIVETLDMPDGRWKHAMVYHEVSDSLLILGGYESGSAFGAYPNRAWLRQSTCVAIDNGSCTPASCVSAAECNDGDTCTEDLCLEGQCRNVPRPGSSECGSLMRVSAGLVHTCLLAADGTLSCWGLHSSGQASPPGGAGWKTLDSWSNTSCALAGGDPVCWGEYSALTILGAEAGFSVGQGFICGQAGDYLLSCTGVNAVGQASPPPFLARQISVGEGHGCGIDYIVSTVQCWGSDSHGQSTAPPGIFLQVSVGSEYSCGIRLDESVLCWGRNDVGQLDAPPGAFKWVSVGNDHSCAIGTDGQIQCWGSNDVGQLDVPPGSYRDLTVGGRHTCAITTTDLVRCWGDNEFGQSTVPVEFAACTLDTQCDDGEPCTTNVCGSGWVPTLATGPSARAHPDMVYDTARQEIVLFGGVNPPSYFGDTWVWDGSNWTPRFSGTSPPARSDHGMAFDSVRDEVVLFGGHDMTGPFDDTWVWNGSEWTQRFPGASPSARTGHRMAFDSARGEVVLFGGSTGLNETWVWNGIDWVQRFPATQPPGRRSFGLAYDEARERIVLFGGFDEGTKRIGDTWEWDGTTWTQMSSTGVLPRAYFRMVYDKARARTLLYGGVTDEGLADDTWEWDGAQWQVVTASSSNGVAHGAMAYDVLRSQTIFFGGYDNIYSFSNSTDTWTGVMGECRALDNGICQGSCTTDDECPGISACYAGECKDAACDGVTCLGGFTCYGGTCFPECTTDDQCNPDHVCYDGRCAPVDDACTGVTCSASEGCYGGTCFATCTEDEMCEPGHVCYDGRCVAEVCDGAGCEPVYCDRVQCGTEWICFWGTCFPQCNSTSCDPASACYSGRCTDDPCEGVSCPALQSCYQGSCFTDCADDLECDPDSYCYNGRCAPTACHDVDCPVGMSCYEGSCFTECRDDLECDATANLYCFNERCATSPCSGVQCVEGFDCVDGQCLAPCGEGGDCGGEDSDFHCYQGHCIPDDCEVPERVRCHANQICYRGTCFYDCSDIDFCEPGHVCYDGRCATDSCAAMIDTYDTPSHHYRRMDDHWPTVVQRSLPWRRPRPVYYSGALGGAMTSMLAPGSGMTAVNQARVVLYFDEDNERYALVLLQGANGAGQGALGATYSVRYFDLPAAPAVRWQSSGTQIEATLRDDDFYHHEIHMRSAGGVVGGAGAVVLGFFPAKERWTVRLSAAFRGDVTSWKFYSAELGHWLELDPREELELTNAKITDDVYLTEEVGVWECRPDDHALGICSRGTITGCSYGWLECTQTVSPWAYETCDGRDNNCDGEVDNLADGVDPSVGVRVPMVYVRQQDAAPWIRVPTIDEARSAFEALNYTPVSGTNYGIGSAAMAPVGPEDVLQQGDHSVMVFHRDVSTSVLTMPLLQGARVVGAYPESAVVEGRVLFKNDTLSDYYDYSDLMFAAWQDDWGQDGAFSMGVEELGIRWDVRRADIGGIDGREADSTLLQIMWQNGASLKPIRFDVVMDTLPESLSTWWLYRPYSALFPLNKALPLQVKIEWVPIEASVCMSATETDGCRMVPYTCSAGQLTCPAATEATCAGCRDRDGDGFFGFDAALCPEGNDCDDTRAWVNPRAEEACDGLDTNCDGFIDGIGPAAIYESCPDGEEICGPRMCQYRPICACTDTGCGCVTALME